MSFGPKKKRQKKARKRSPQDIPVKDILAGISSAGAHGDIGDQIELNRSYSARWGDTDFEESEDESPSHSTEPTSPPRSSDFRQGSSRDGPHPASSNKKPAKRSPSSESTTPKTLNKGKKRERLPSSSVKTRQPEPKANSSGQAGACQSKPSSTKDHIPSSKFPMKTSRKEASSSSRSSAGPSQERPLSSSKLATAPAPSSGLQPSSKKHPAEEPSKIRTPLDTLRTAEPISSQRRRTPIRKVRRARELWPRYLCLVGHSEHYRIGGRR